LKETTSKYLSMQDKAKTLSFIIRLMAICSEAACNKDQVIIFATEKAIDVHGKGARCGANAKIDS